METEKAETDRMIQIAVFGTFALAIYGGYELAKKGEKVVRTKVRDFRAKRNAKPEED
jgi:hypothetical protein